MYFEETDIYAGMDPRLQWTLDRRRRGRRTLETASSSAEEVGVVALVSDLQRWRDRTDVREGATPACRAAGLRPWR